MGTDLDIRRYRPDDRERVLALHEEPLRAVGTDPEDVPGTEDLSDIEGAYIDAGGEFLVGSVDGEIVAMGGLKRGEAARGELFRMRVDTSYQGRGYGAAILGALESAAEERGIELLVLETAVRQNAVPFYRAHGYRETARRHEDGYELVSMEKRL